VVRLRLDTLAALRAVADKGSFTQAAAELGLTQSALSHAIRRLEAEAGCRLLSRTTRSVAPTEAGETLLARLGPALDEIANALSQLRVGAGQPTGTVRLTMGRDAAELLVVPFLTAFNAAHPGIRVEIAATDSLTDVIRGRFDGGIRLGDRLEQDMIARRLTSNARPVVIGAPNYFDRAGIPRTPDDLKDHLCLGYRMHFANRVFPWRFDGPEGAIEHRDVTQFVFNDGALLRQAAIEGLGLAYLWRHMVRQDLETGRLKMVMEDHIAAMPGFYLYYPSRDVSPAMSAFSNALIEHCKNSHGF